MSNAGSKRPAADANANNRRKKKKTKDPSDRTMGEHHLLTEDKKERIKAFGEYCREKNMTMKDLFLKCSDKEQTQAWPLIVSKLLMELVAKIDSIMQEIQKDRQETKEQCFCRNKNCNFTNDYGWNHANFSDNGSGNTNKYKHDE
jgi:hypothetical protein